MNHVAQIVIADDHSIVRKGLRQIISETSDLVLAGEASNSAELLTLLRSRAFDLVVLDITLGTRSGIDVLKHIKSEFPRLPVLVLSVHEERIFAVRALRAGAAGYIQKHDAADQLLHAIRKILSGGIYLSEAMTQQTAARGVLLPHERLSDRELEVFRLLGSGRSVTDISRVLNLSVKTVSTHRTRILEKTGLSGNADIVRYVVTHQLA